MLFDMVLTTCPFCGTGCNFYLQVIDGEITDVVPCKTHPVSQGELCVLGRNAHRYLKSDDRLKSPLVKKNGTFSEVTWEEAISIVAENLKKIKEENGPDSIGVLSSAKCTNEENYLIMKFTRGVIGTNNIDHCARLCHASTVAGLAASFGSGAMTNSIDEIEDAECIVVIGSNTTSQHPVISSRVMRAVTKGAKLIVIDPREIPLTKYSHIFLQIYPGTNIALLNGLLNIIIKEDLIDKEFIEERTEGFDKVREIVKEYDLDKVSKITGVNPDLIKEAALTYAKTEKAMILYAMGVTQHTTGTDQVKAVANLAMATGHIGKPSTGVNPLRGQNNVQGACDVGALPDVFTGYQRVEIEEVRRKFEEAWGVSLSERPGLTVVEMMQGALDGSIKGMMIVGENPMVSDPDIGHVKEALSNLDFLVVQDIFMTETAELADVVLPACVFSEKEGTFTGTDRRVQRVRKAIDPLFNSKPDWEITSLIAREMGAEGFEFSSPEEIMKEIASLTPSYGGITYARLDKGEVLQWPCLDEKHPGTPILHKDQFARGKGRFFPVEYIEPPELPDDEYPYLLNTGRVPFHFHTGTITRRIERLDNEVPEGRVDIHPEDAKEIGVEEGEMVKVISRRGAISLKVRISKEVEPGTVFIPMHFAESAANVLTDTRLDPEAKIPSLKVSAVKIEKAA